ncbi:MAG TPA: anthranilate synthase component I [Candidatus Polarisedimenticolia bacterium]|nr:anthranilate synthase component I [Candidatus Polarisedimenticolia bacterium]
MIGGPPFRPGEEEFGRLRQGGNLIPVCREIAADLLTPVSASMRLAVGARQHFLLESVEGGESLARYSFLGRDPFCVLKGWGRRSVLEEGGRSRSLAEDPLEALRMLSRRYRPVPIPDLPRFAGGGVGYISYDLARLRERIPFTVVDDLQVPDLVFGFYDLLLAFDHPRQRIQIISLVRTEDGKGSWKARYREACRRILAIERRLAEAPPRHRLSRPRVAPRLRPTRPDREFLHAVEQARRAIRAGEIFQVVLSRRFEHPAPASPFSVYRTLRRLNPSPYLFYLAFPEVTLAGASPEMLVRVEGSRIQTRPIAGTRPRGSGEEEDRILEASLRADAKERSEHLMLVDLGRNDLGRVCRFGSVTVKQFMEVERYSHVMHLVSSLEGALRPGVHPAEALMACFPAGTVTGAPKLRAMEIIDRLEGLKRGPYAGVVGYVDFSGNLDTCITLRTAVMKGRTAYLQAGAGIVADSTPARENRECLSKAQVLFTAVREAGRMV